MEVAKAIPAGTNFLTTCGFADFFKIYLYSLQCFTDSIKKIEKPEKLTKIIRKQVQNEEICIMIDIKMQKINV